MKRYKILAVVTTVAIAAILGGGWLQRAGVRDVQAVIVQPQTVKETVLCSGTVQAADSTEVKTDYPCVVKQVKVNAGDHVEKGEVLFTIDTAKTAAVVKQAGLSSSLPKSMLPTEMVAPCAGYVTTLNVKSGGTADGTTPCAVISENTQVQISILIGESSLKKIAVGQTAEISGAAFARERYTGKVAAIDSAAHTSYVGTNSETVVGAVITLPESEIDDSLRLGLTAKADIVVAQQDAVMVVPYDCVGQDDQNCEYVYVVQDGVAEKRVIETGAELSDGFEVTAGLQAGDCLVRTPDVLSGARAVVRVTSAAEGGGAT